MNNVYPDGEALSEWERGILDEIEWDFELSDGRLVGVVFDGDAPRLSALAAYHATAESAAAFAALTFGMAGALARLAAIGTSLWVTSVGAHGMQLLDRVMSSPFLGEMLTSQDTKFGRFHG